MRKIHLIPAAMGLLLLLFLQSGGMLVVYSLQQGMHQYKMMRKLEKEKGGFETLKISFDTYVKSLVEEHEVCLNGQMFDIQKVRHFNDSVELTARRDHKEEQILLAIRKTLPGSQHHRKVPDYLLKMMAWPYLQTRDLDFSVFPCLVQGLPGEDSADLRDQFTGPGSPPPEIRNAG